MSSHLPTAPPDCPDLESIAALLDKRLTGAERDAVVAHLSTCDACYEIFSETQRTLEEQRPAGVVVPLRSPWRNRLLAAAAVLFLMVAIPLMWLAVNDGPAPELRTAELVAELTAPGTDLAAGIYSGDEWSRTRGFGSSLEDRQRAFRLGVRTVDLEIALRSGDAVRATQLVHELSDIANGLPLPEMIVASYDDLLARLERGEPVTGLGARSAAAAELIADSAEPPYYRLGQWAEAGLVASTTANLDFLRGPAADLPSGARRADLPTTASEALSAIGAILSRGADPDDLPALADSFRALVAHGGNL